MAVTMHTYYLPHAIPVGAKLALLFPKVIFIVKVFLIQ